MEATLHSRWMAWRRFLGFLIASDPNSLSLSPLQRVTIERVRSYARHLGETNTPHSVACQVDVFYGAVRILLHKQDWTWLCDIKKRLFAAAPPPRREPVITSMQLLDLGLELMAESKMSRDVRLTLDAAVKYRDGLMIAFFAYIPVRHKNFAAIEIGGHLIKEDDHWTFIIPPEESKTKVPIEFEIPTELAAHLEVYLHSVRPRLVRQLRCNALWVSAKGGQLSYSAVGPVITRHTTVRLGIRVTPYDARDAAVTFWAIKAPGQIGVARDLMAHERLSTTNKYYNRARGIEASRRQARLIAEMIWTTGIRLPGSSNSPLPRSRTTNRHLIGALFAARGRLPWRASAILLSSAVSAPYAFNGGDGCLALRNQRFVLTRATSALPPIIWGLSEIGRSRRKVRYSRYRFLIGI